MSSFSERRRNNVRAGVFVTITMILAIAVILVLTDAVSMLTSSVNDYTVNYMVRHGVGNLKPGSEVRVGGVAMGRVVKVQPQLDGVDSFEQIDVHFTLDSRVKLYSDALILVSSPLLGSESWLDIPYVGSVESGPPPGGTIEGARASGVLSTLLGAENASRTEAIIDNAYEFVAFLGEAREVYQRDVSPILTDVQNASADIRSITADVNENRWPTWSETIDTALTDASGLLSDSRDIVAENREPVKSAIGNIESASADVADTTARLNAETVDRFNHLVDTAQTALDDVVAAVATIRQDYEGWSVDLGETMAAASLASQQLKLTTIEVRRSPWKLLYRPSATELEHELLYEAARSFAMAAADLKSTSQAVNRMLDRHADALAGDEAALRRIEQRLTTSFEHYEQAQQQLFDIIVTDLQ